jgi:DNA-binding NarL/FixJ family response regulator
MAGIGKVNLNVVVVDSDRYAMSAINAYFAWDRRTTVIYKSGRLEDFWTAYNDNRLNRRPDVFVIDANHLGGAAQLESAIKRLRQAFRGIRVICLAQFADLDLIHAAAEADAKAYWLKDDVRLHIGWAVCACLCLARDAFSVSSGVEEAGRRLAHPRLRRSRTLPGPKQYQDLKPRKRDAIVLNAIEGMSHRLVAHEMGIALSTVQGYIKEARRTLGSYHDDIGDYPDDMSPQEIDFMRLTALELSDDCLKSLRNYPTGRRR